MDKNSVTREIFNALDTENEGFISKQHFINQMAEYLSQTEVQCTDYALNKLSIVNNYPDMIDYEDFCLFYQDLMGSQADVIAYENVDLNDGDQTDSEIYESQADNDIDFDNSREGLQNSVVNLMDFKRMKNVENTDLAYRRKSVTSAGSCQQHRQRRCSTAGFYSPATSLNRRRSIADSVILRSSNISSVSDDRQLDDFDELSCLTDSGLSSSLGVPYSAMAAATGSALGPVCSAGGTEEEIDRLMHSYKSVVSELGEFKHKWEESHMRYQKQREVTKFHNERIMMLEEQIRQLEIAKKEEIEYKRKEEGLLQKRRQDNVDQNVGERVFREDVLNRLSTIETQYTLSRTEYERIKKECDVLIKEKDQLKKELKSSEKRCRELENTFKNYKDSVNTQIDELQRERDNAETTNKDLSDRLIQQQQELGRLHSGGGLFYSCNNAGGGTSQQSQMQPLSPQTLPPMQAGTRPSSWAGPVHSRQTSCVSSTSSKLSLDGVSTGGSGVSCTTISQLEQVVHKLTMQNRNLVEKVTHLETLEFYQRPQNRQQHCGGGGTNGTSSGSGGFLSLADEFEQLNFGELKNELAKEREVASRLHIYIMSLTNRLMQAGYIEAFRQRGTAV